MSPIGTPLLALLVAGTVMTASAQANPPGQPPPGPPPRPQVIIIPNDIYRAPTPPPDRPDPPPRPALSPPMERVPQVPPMSPRVGN